MTDTGDEAKHDRPTPVRPESVDRALGKVKKGVTAGDDDEEVKFKSVKELSHFDPPIGLPMRFQDVNGVWVPIEPGDWRYADRITGRMEVTNDAGERVEVQILDPETGLPVNFPVQPLGVRGKMAYFMSAKGEVIEMKGSDGKGDYEMLFAGRNDYLPWWMPRRAKAKANEGPGPIVGWEADQARQALIKIAGHLPTFRNLTDVRGRGMWRDHLGLPVYHAGDAIYIKGGWVKPGRYGDYIYPALPRIGRPKAHKAMVKSAGARVLAALETWNWQRKRLDPRLMLGWLMVAKMGAAINNRPTIWITGAGGAGKSYLQTFVRSMQNSGLVAASNISAAGAYQELGQDCVPLCLDEMESSEDNRKITGIIELFRISYSGDNLVRGDKDGKSKTFTLRSACMASSISKPSMGSQDDSRMALLNLRPIEGEQPPAYTLDEAYKFGQVLARRAIDCLPKWEKVHAMFEGAMRSRPGHSQRSLDTFSPLAAGYHIALHDTLPTAEELNQWAEWLDPAQLVEVVSQIPTWEQCIRHLLGKIPEVWKNKTHKTLGQILREYMKHGNKIDVDERIVGTRICVIVPKKFMNKDRSQFEARLFIPNSDSVLVDIFAGTAWGGSLGTAGPWNGVLRQASEELWQSDTSSKGGLGSERGVSFHICELMVALGQDPWALREEDDLKPDPADRPDPGEAFGG